VKLFEVECNRSLLVIVVRCESR